MSMKGKTLVITGATKGIGKATAQKFASNGVNVAFTYNSNKEIAKEIEEKVSYPGEIKVNVIRESRAIEFAK